MCCDRSPSWAGPAPALEAGRLDERVSLAGNDELAELGQRFNRMAERLEAQMALVRANEAYLQEILDGLPDGVRVIRAGDMRVVLANRAFCQQIGQPVESSHPSALPSEQPQPRHALRRHAGGLPAGRAEASRRDPQGHPLPPTAPTAASSPPRFTPCWSRSTDAPAAERYIVESVRDLGQAARISHEQRLSELGLLAAGIAHEIHNPLGSVRLGVQGLTREIREARISPEQIVDYMDLIDQEIDNCIAVTRRLLLLARPPANSLQLVVLNEALTDTLHLLEFDAQTRKIGQIADLPATPLRVLADEAEIRMIFLNLMQNAHHAMPDGGTLTARLASRRRPRRARDHRHRHRHGARTRP